jgi:MOSC domain-containing protein YiiM
MRAVVASPCRARSRGNMPFFGLHGAFSGPSPVLAAVPPHEMALPARAMLSAELQRHMYATDPLRNSSLRDLLTRRAQPGMLTWIGIRPARGAALIELSAVTLLTQRGVEGDIATAREAGKRQVSLIQAEHLPVIAALSGNESVHPGMLRRNLVVSGINLLALRSARFRIGDTLLEGTGTCDPCSKMERALGQGGYNAMRGHGGIVARVIAGGRIALHDEVDLVLEAG